MLRFSTIRRGILRKSSSALLLRAGLAFIAFIAVPLRGQDVRPTEYQVKAAYVYNFGKFVTWPSNATPETQSFDICILGKDPFGPVIDATVAGDSIDGKRIIVRRIAKVQEVDPCSVLFISQSEERRLAPVLADAKHLNLLTVSDIKDFAERGGMIGLVTQGDRIRFVVNRKAADEAHLQLSSELLKVATRVIGAKAAE